MSATQRTAPASDPAGPGAVLLLIFNRPELTARVFAAIREARPARLYIAADGPRPQVAGDAALCQRARSVARAVDWTCAVQERFRDRNLGCRRAVTDAIDWFFANESEGIVLEDDCLPRPEFFRFCADMLMRYRDDPRIISISGSCFYADPIRRESSFYFGKHFHCWGWATWKRGWLAVHPDRPPDRPRRRQGLRALSDGQAWFSAYWRGIEELCTRALVDSWAYRVSLASFECWAGGEGPLHVVPRVNLVDNIGGGREATHASDPVPVARAQALEFPLVAPRAIVRDAERDRWTDEHVFGVSWRTVLRMRLSLHWQSLRRSRRPQ